jgi:hypothetical protein
MLANVSFEGKKNSIVSKHRINGKLVLLVRKKIGIVGIVEGWITIVDCIKHQDLALIMKPCLLQVGELK